MAMAKLFPTVHAAVTLPDVPNEGISSLTESMVDFNRSGGNIVNQARPPSS